MRSSFFPEALARDNAQSLRQTIQELGAVSRYLHRTLVLGKPLGNNRGTEAPEMCKFTNKTEEKASESTTSGFRCDRQFAHSRRLQVIYSKASELAADDEICCDSRLAAGLPSLADPATRKLRFSP